jgi:hypothetical protein
MLSIPTCLRRLSCALIMVAALSGISALNASAGSGLFSKWDLIAATGFDDSSRGPNATNDAVFVRNSDHFAVSGYFGGTGYFANTGTTDLTQAGLGNNWTSVAGSPYYTTAGTDLLFYDAASGTLRFARLAPAGYGSIEQPAACKNRLAANAIAYTDIVWTRAPSAYGANLSTLVFYSRQNAQLATGTFNSETCTFTKRTQVTVGTLARNRLGTWYTQPYSKLASTGPYGNRLLLYQQGTGNALSGYITTGGAFQQQRYFAGAFGANWTSIVGGNNGSGGGMLFYGNGVNALGNLSADGSFVTTSYQGAGLPTLVLPNAAGNPADHYWTTFISWPGNQVFFAYMPTGQGVFDVFNPAGLTLLDAWG